MKQTLCTLICCMLGMLPNLVLGEGSKQLTPYTTTNGTTDTRNTSVGYLQHDDNGSQTISYGFLKPSSWSYNGATFIEDYRMYVRVKPGETLYYGVRRRVTNASKISQNDLILTLKYGSGTGITLKADTLVRNVSSTNQSALLSQPGVIDTPVQANNGPNYNGRTNGYNALSYTNNTGDVQDFYLEFTQVNEAAMSSNAKKSWYDLWDLTVVSSDGLVKPGRLFSKQWSFTAGASSNVLSSTFAFYPLIPNQLDGSTFYIKKITLAGMRPFGFRFVTNRYGSTDTYGATFQERRKSQLVQSDYSEYLNFVNDPDEEIWPSAPDPNFSFTAESVCDGAQPTIVFTSDAGVPSNFLVQIDVNGDGYIPNTADVLMEQTFEAGSHKLIWDGKDAYGNSVPSGTTLSYTYKSFTSPMNFPVFDAEGNASGFKSENVRPVPSTVNDLLYWDDSNLPISKFPETTQKELNGINANTGAHLWGSTADDGNGYTINTWTYGYTFTRNDVLVFNYDCSTDLEVKNTVPQDSYFKDDLVTFTVKVTNNGPTDAKTVTVDYPLFSGFKFVSATPDIGTYDLATGIWHLGVPLVVGQSRTMIFKVIATTVGNWSTTAIVSTDQVDTNSNNNTSKATIKVNPVPEPLPVTIVSFNVKPENKGALLSWITAYEFNNSFFDVERSSDGKSFIQIGRVIGNGNSNINSSYSFSDDQAPAGTVYYRLKQVDSDGKFTYSNVKVIQVAQRNAYAKIVVFPNPVNSTLNLDMTMLNDGVYELQIKGISGITLMHKRNLESGVLHQLDLSSLPSGFLILRIASEDFSQVLQLLKNN